MGKEAQRLRQSVLQAAIQGKLVLQDPTDEPASVLLERIAAEKERLIKAGKAKRQKAMPPVSEEEKKFELPSSWEWARLGEVASKVTDGTHHSPPNAEAGDFMYITAKNIKESGVSTENITYVTEDVHSEIYARCDPEPGDILIIKDGATTGIVTLNNLTEPFSMLSSVALIKTVGVLNAFLVYALRASVFNSSLRKQMQGTGITRITLKQIVPFPIPLPPLDEQHRIVAKLEEIMPLIDEFEQLEDELTQLETELPKKLKRAVLQAGIEGKLVPQDPNDEPASVLLERIAAEREQLIKEGKIKKPKALRSAAEHGEPFEIPDTWAWARLIDTGILVRGSGIKRSEIVEDSEYPCVRYGELYTTYHGTFSSAVSRTTEAVFNKSKKAVAGDILMALTGENDFDIALARPYVGEETIAYGGDMTVLHPLLVHYGYLASVLNSNYGVRQKQKDATGDIIVHISNDKLARISIPLPPQAEQQRIVAKLEEVMPVIDSIKQDVANAYGT